MPETGGQGVEPIDNINIKFSISLLLLEYFERWILGLTLLQKLACEVFRQSGG